MPWADTPKPPGPDPTHSQDLQIPLLSSQIESSHLPEKLSMDDMLHKYCGEMGTWQMRHFLLTSLAWSLQAFHTMVIIFSDRQPSWRCSSAACTASSDLCSLPLDAWEWVGGPTTSTVSEWDLVCGEKYKLGLLHALFFAGCMIGAGVFGHLSDSTLGRRGSLTIVCCLNAIFGFLTAFSPSFPIYAILRILTGFSTGGVGLCAFVLATEPIGPSMRGFAGMSTFYFFAAGNVLLSGVAFLFPSWRQLYIASSLPSVLFIILIAPFLSESPRWWDFCYTYLARGHLSRAMQIMHAIAASNNQAPLPTGVTLALDKSSDDDSSGGTKGSLIDVLRSSMTRRRLFLAVAINFLCSVIYYGVSLNVVNLNTNLYFNVILNAMAEMPAYLITALMINRYGRKPLMIGMLWFSDIFCLLGSLFNTQGSWNLVRMMCGVLAIFGMAGTYNLLFIYTTELFPTVVRNAALGCTMQAAQMGAILAPLVVVCGGRLPFVVFAGCGIIAGVLGFWVPETLNRPLYDTMAGIEEGEADSEQ